MLALDGDSGANGTVRYSSRARAAGGALCVHARLGRLYLAAPLRVGQLVDLTVSTTCLLLTVVGKVGVVRVA